MNNKNQCFYNIKLYIILLIKISNKKLIKILDIVTIINYYI